MGKTTVYAWALLLLLLTAPITVALAQMTAPSANGEEVVGTVVQVDAAKGDLTIQKKDNTSASFRIDSGTAITVDGKAAKLAELKTGHQVTLSMDGLKVLSIKATSSTPG